MSTPRPRSSHADGPRGAPDAWIVVAHALGGALVGLLEAARLGSLGLGLALVPLFALTGLVAGGALAAAERASRGRPPWVVALAIAAPSLVVTVYVGRSVFRGAYAQTLPLAGVLPYLLPLVAWLGLAAVVWLGRRLAASDLTSRAIAICAAAGVLGAIVWTERHILGTGYPDAQSGAALAVIVIGGILIRLVRRVHCNTYVAAALAALVLGTGIAAIFKGLADPAARSLLANRGDHGRDLVRLWRLVLDLDRDGSSAVLGGGDCDDRDATRHPGAIDLPGDGIDQDCDGKDAVRSEIVARPPPLAELATWRASPEVRGVLDTTREMNVLLVTVDALRYDLLAPDAPHREDFPNLTKLLDESVTFTRAFSPAAGTDISLSTLMTGRADPFQRVESTLAEALRASGRRTSMAVPEEVTRHVGQVLLARGFDTTRAVYTDWEQRDHGDHVSAGTTTAEGLRAFEKAGSRTWFAWLHYFDVHEHHQLTVPAELLPHVWDGGSEKAHAYRALLFGIDRSFGRLLEDLAKRGLLDRTIIVFASDHGESLGDDPRLPATHGQVAYAPLVHVPLAFKVPGATPGLRTETVTLVDVAPTLLDLVGTPGAIHPLDGFDLVPVILDAPAELRPPRDRAVVVHEELQWSVIEWPYQLVMRPNEDLVELYDLAHDPYAKQDLAQTLPEITSRLKARYAEAPVVRVDRTATGRAWREQQARPPQPRARP